MKPSERLARINDLNDRLATVMRKPRAAPILDPNEVIAWALNSIEFQWWPRSLKEFRGFTETSIPVTTVLCALRLAGYKIVPMERADYERTS